MKPNWKSMPGPGDPETWTPYAGHPLDPRAPMEPDEDKVRYQITEMIKDDQGLYWDTIDGNDLGDAQWGWYCKMDEINQRNITDCQRQYEMEAVTVELFTKLNNRILEKLWDRAEAAVIESEAEDDRY